MREFDSNYYVELVMDDLREPTAQFKYFAAAHEFAIAYSQLWNVAGWHVELGEIHNDVSALFYKNGELVNWSFSPNSSIHMGMYFYGIIDSDGNYMPKGNDN